MARPLTNLAIMSGPKTVAEPGKIANVSFLEQKGHILVQIILGNL